MGFLQLTLVPGLFGDVPNGFELHTLKNRVTICQLPASAAMNYISVVVLNP